MSRTPPLQHDLLLSAPALIHRMYRMAATVALYSHPNSSEESTAPSLTVARCAVQYNGVRWGTSSCRVRAGIAIYEHGSSGRLAAARVDDDVQAPVEGR